jgi:hypothetical protein
MDAEITLELKGKNINDSITAIEEVYQGNNLQVTYLSTRYNTVVPQNTFSFGHTATDCRILVSKVGNELKIYLENTVNPSDFKQLHSRIENTYSSIAKGLKAKRIKVGHSKTIVTVGNFQIPGEKGTTWGQIKADFNEKKDKWFIEPIAAFIISFFALKFGFVTLEDHDKDLVKILIGVAEVYLGVIIVYFGKLLLKKREKRFTFKLEI